MSLCYAVVYVMFYEFIIIHLFTHKLFTSELLARIIQSKLALFRLSPGQIEH